MKYNLLSTIFIASSISKLNGEKKRKVWKLCRELEKRLNLVSDTASAQGTILIVWNWLYDFCFCFFCVCCTTHITCTQSFPRSKILTMNVLLLPITSYCTQSNSNSLTIPYHTHYSCKNKRRLASTLQLFHSQYHSFNFSSNNNNE